MSKALIAYFRHTLPTDTTEWGKSLCARITPDNAHPREPRIVTQGNAVSVVYNPSANLQADGLSFVLGATSQSGPQQLQLDSPVPAGTFALMRASSHRVQASTDYTASRTIWYCLTNDVFVVATSQRMLAAAIGSFQPNQRALAWFLASGTLGPDNAWDDRIRILPGNSSVYFNARHWHVDLDVGESLFVRETRGPKSRHKQRLHDAVAEATASMVSTDTSWVLALSGGMDSRSLLYHLRSNPAVEAVTWGLAESRDIPGGDAAVAVRLATDTGIPHSYWSTDIGPEQLDRVFSRFIAAGEGRLDHLSGYMDGLELWSGLSTRDSVMIRGYDAFGTKPAVINEYQARDTSNLVTSADFRGEILPEPLRTTPSDIPDRLRTTSSEGLSNYRDRLWLEYRTPYVTAALDDIKFAYTEVINPLLSRPVVEAVRTLPASMRTRKRLFREIVEEMFPGVPFARRDSVQHIGTISRRSDVKDFVRGRLRQIDENSIIPQALANWLAGNLAQHQQSAAFKQQIIQSLSSRLPVAAKDLLRLIAQRAPGIDVRRVALRAVLADLAVRQLTADAALFASRPEFNESPPPTTTTPCDPPFPT